MKTFDLENGHSLIVEETEKKDTYKITFLEDGKPLMSSERASKDYIEWYYGIKL